MQRGSGCFGYCDSFDACHSVTHRGRVQAVQKLLGEALAEHHDSAYLHVVVARYLLAFRSNDYLAFAHLKIAQVSFPRLLFGFDL